MPLIRKPKRKPFMSHISVGRYVHIEIPTDNKTPAQRVKDKYEGIVMTSTTKALLLDEMKALDYTDQYERTTTPEREEAKVYIRNYLQQIENNAMYNFELRQVQKRWSR